MQRIAKQRIGEVQFRFARPIAVSQGSRTASLPARARKDDSASEDTTISLSNNFETFSNPARLA